MGIKLFFIGVIVSVLYNQDSITDLRNIYQKQDKIQILAAIEQLEAKKLSNNEDCYYGAFLCIQAQYLISPYSKMKSFNLGYEKINTAILKEPKNPEFRYHRYMIEENAPSFIIKINHQKEDKNIVQQFLTKDHPMYAFILKSMKG